VLEEVTGTMSSRTRTGSDRRPLRAAALLLALIAPPAQAPPAQAPPATLPLPVASVLVAGGQTSLVVDLSASTRPGPRTVTVTREGVPQKASLVPVMSDGLAVALVVDTSTAGAANLPAWLSAAARFILEAPGTTQAVAIADTAPAATITTPQRGPTGIVRALDSVRAHGDRDTAAALTLATRQFPGTPPGRRVTVLYTTAADAGGETAAALGESFRAAGTILVVVGTADASPYWSDAAAVTGGFFAPAGNPIVVPALDQVETTLTGRYLIQFPTPPALPTRVSLRVTTADFTMTADATIPAAASPAAAPGRPATSRWALIGAGFVVALAAAILLLLRLRLRLRLRRSRRRTRAAGSGPSAIARGRAQVPDPVARGRAQVPPIPHPPNE